LGAKLQKQFNAEIELIAGTGGALEVSVDGTEIFSKKKIGHFPTAEELYDLIPQS
jgi:selT/selW/selH-like putative selenoprotein